ncbi:MAG: sodium:solute symporter [Flavobacteriales bacterium]|nr:sodium:solute symporter [Flavobacteriales bacterium]
MSSSAIGLIIAGYFLLLIIVSRLTARKGDNAEFFTGGRNAHWMVVAFGMIGASLSGVTFISVPGWVATSQFSYMQMVLGYILGYALIAGVLLPVYYRLRLTSIYTYLKDRFGNSSYKTGASFFLISRVIGASFRLFLVALVLRNFVFDEQLDSLVENYRWINDSVAFLGIIVLTILLIWVYTSKGGIKTIIWTDTLQTVCMLLAVVIAVIGIGDAMQLNIKGIINEVKDSEYSQIFFWGDGAGKKHFVKQFLSGAGIALVMTGLDQDMMQKNLACKNLKDAQKNVLSLSVVLVFVNLLFLSLGALLYLYASESGIVIPEKADLLFATVALEGGLGPLIGLFFILGLIASAYSSADSALTALTTSFYVDMLDSPGKTEKESIAVRRKVHVGMSVALVLVIWLFYMINDESVIASLFRLAGYTYGPLLGLYAFGLFTKREVRDKWVPLICVLAPAISWLLATYIYPFGFELLLINGAITFMGLMVIMRK